MGCHLCQLAGQNGFLTSKEDRKGNYDGKKEIHVNSARIPFFPSVCFFRGFLSRLVFHCLLKILGKIYIPFGGGKFK